MEISSYCLNATVTKSWLRPVREKCSYQEFFWSLFSQIQTGYGDLFKGKNNDVILKVFLLNLNKSPYSVQMRENTDQNNSEYGHFSHSGNSTI